MNGGIPQPLQRGPMSLGAIAFVFPQPVAWIACIQFLHLSIAFGLRQNGGAGNAQAKRIAFDERCLRNVKLGEFESKIG